EKRSHSFTGELRAQEVGRQVERMARERYPYSLDRRAHARQRAREHLAVLSWHNTIPGAMNQKRGWDTRVHVLSWGRQPVGLGAGQRGPAERRAQSLAQICNLTTTGLCVETSKVRGRVE